MNFDQLRYFKVAAEEDPRSVQVNNSIHIRLGVTEINIASLIISGYFSQESSAKIDVVMTTEKEAGKLDARRRRYGYDDKQLQTRVSGIRRLHRARGTVLPG